MLSILVNSVYWYVIFLTPTHTYVLSCITWFTYPLSYNLTGSIMSTSSYSSCKSYLSNWHISVTSSITLSPPSLSLTLKILLASRLSTRGIVFFYLIYYYPSLMPPSIASIYYTTLVAFILSINKDLANQINRIKALTINLLIIYALDRN